MTRSFINHVAQLHMHCGGRIGARLGCLAAPRWGDSQHHASTTARTRLPEPCSWKTDAAIAPVASVAAFLIFTSRACGQAWRQALAGSTLRSSARGRRGPLRSRGTVAEVCPRSGSIRSRSSTHRAERQASQRARAAGVAASRIGAPVPPAQPAPPCVAASHRSGLVGQLSVPGPGAAQEHIRARHRRASSRRAVA